MAKGDSGRGSEAHEDEASTQPDCHAQCCRPSSYVVAIYGNAALSQYPPGQEGWGVQEFGALGIPEEVGVVRHPLPDHLRL